MRSNCACCSHYGVLQSCQQLRYLPAAPGYHGHMWMRFGFGACLLPFTLLSTWPYVHMVPLQKSDTRMRNARAVPIS